jgi:hypothetical protein
VCVCVCDDGGFATAADADDVQAFFAANPCPQASMHIAQAVETIRSLASTVEREGAAITAFLEAWDAANPVITYFLFASEWMQMEGSLG